MTAIAWSGAPSISSRSQHSVLARHRESVGKSIPRNQIAEVDGLVVFALVICPRVLLVGLIALLLEPLGATKRLSVQIPSSNR